MTDVNKARFTINGSPSEDGAGNPGYNATPGELLECTLEVNPSDALSVLYEVYSTSDNSSPLASLGAPTLTWTASGTYQQLFSSVNDVAELQLPSIGVNSWIVRCTARTPEGSDVWERMVVQRTDTSPAMRRFIPGETEQYRRRGFADDLTNMVAFLEGFEGGGPAVILKKEVAPTVVAATDSEIGEIDLGLAQGDVFETNAWLTAGSSDYCSVQFAAASYVGTPTDLYKIGADDQGIQFWNPDSEGPWNDKNPWGFSGLTDGKLYYKLVNNGSSQVTMAVRIWVIGSTTAL